MAGESKGALLRSNRRFSLFTQANGQCEYCGDLVLLPFGTVDHRIPKAAGGRNVRHNLAWACRHCNAAKAAESEAQFRELAKVPRGVFSMTRGHSFGLTKPVRKAPEPMTLAQIIRTASA